MSEKRKKNKLEKHWEEAAALFEAPGIEALRGSRVLSAVESRRLLGPGRTKLVSIRVPEADLEAVKEIAERHGRKYQHLMTLALGQFIERYVESASRKK
jgi:hypothetical protein